MQKNFYFLVFLIIEALLLRESKFCWNTCVSSLQMWVGQVVGCVDLAGEIQYLSSFTQFHIFLMSGLKCERLLLRTVRSLYASQLESCLLPMTC